MSFGGFLIFLFLFCGIIAAISMSVQKTMPPAQRRRLQRKFRVAQAHGSLSAKMACPHCQDRNCVHTKQVAQKKGVSGGKATGALLTGGVSLLATGLSRKEKATEAYCSNCSSTWHF